MSIENINEHNGKVGSATRLNFPPMTDALIWRVRVRHLQGHLSSSLSKAKQAHLQWKGMGQMGTWERLLTLLFLLSAVSAEHEGRPVCPTIGTTTSSTRLQSSDPVKSFNEISGLALSPVQTAPSGEPVLFGVSDGGGGERLGMFDSGTGQRLLTLEIPNDFFTNKDWESMAIGSCGSTGVSDSCLYIADTGDNTARTNSGRKTGRGSSTPYRILKIREPLLQDFSATNNTIPTSYLSLLTFNYKDSSSPTDYADCEALFLDHVGWGDGARIGDLYLVTKWDQNRRKRNNRLFKIPSSAWPATMNGSASVLYSPKAVGNYDDTSSSVGALQQYTWTGADATFDGSLIALGTTEGNFLFLRCPGATVAETLAGGTQPCLEWKSPSPGQVETISWTVDGLRSINIPEGSNRPLGWTTLQYDVNNTTQTCPQMEWVTTTVASGQQVRYCRSREDGSGKPSSWCEGVNIVVNSLSGEIPQGSNMEIIEEVPVDPIEETTVGNVAEETDEEIIQGGSVRRRLRFTADSSQQPS